MFFLGLYKDLKSFFSLKNAETKEKIYLVQSKKMFDEFFNTRESNENETCKEFDIEEVNSEAGSTRDLLIEVCADLCIVTLNQLSFFG